MRFGADMMDHILATLRNARGFARALWLFIRGEIGARLRGDLEIDIEVTIPARESLEGLVVSFSDTFRADRPRIGFGGDGAGRWSGSARVRHHGDIAGTRSRLELWARSRLPPEATFHIRRIGRPAAG